MEAEWVDLAIKIIGGVAVFVLGGLGVRHGYRKKRRPVVVDDEDPVSYETRATLPCVDNRQVNQAMLDMMQRVTQTFADHAKESAVERERFIGQLALERSATEDLKRVLVKIEERLETIDRRTDHIERDQKDLPEEVSQAVLAAMQAAEGA